MTDTDITSEIMEAIKEVQEDGFSISETELVANKETIDDILRSSDFLHSDCTRYPKKHDIGMIYGMEVIHNEEVSGFELSTGIPSCHSCSCDKIYSDVDESWKCPFCEL